MCTCTLYTYSYFRHFYDTFANFLGGINMIINVHKKLIKIMLPDIHDLVKLGGVNMIEKVSLNQSC